jgi:hypothetical protein
MSPPSPPNPIPIHSYIVQYSLYSVVLRAQTESLDVVKSKIALHTFIFDKSTSLSPPCSLRSSNIHKHVNGVLSAMELFTNALSLDIFSMYNFYIFSEAHTMRDSVNCILSFPLKVSGVDVFNRSFGYPTTHSHAILRNIVSNSANDAVCNLRQFQPSLTQPNLP